MNNDVRNTNYYPHFLIYMSQEIYQNSTWFHMNFEAIYLTLPPLFEFGFEFEALEIVTKTMIERLLL